MRIVNLWPALGLCLVLAPAAHAQEDVSSIISKGTDSIVFDEVVPSSVFRDIAIPAGGSDVDIFLRDCCIRDDKVEVYVDGCLVATVISDDPGAPDGSHVGETHTVSLDEGTHTIEYRNTFSRVGQSGWEVSEDLVPFTGNFALCSIRSVDVTCRPLDSEDDPLRLPSKAGRHCFYLVETFSGIRATYAAYSISDQLTPAKNGRSDLLSTVPCGDDTFQSVCIEVTPPTGQTLESIVDALEAAVMAGSQGAYDNITNNSNLWVEKRALEIGLDVDLPVSAITGVGDAAIQLPIAVVKWLACGVTVTLIPRLKCLFFDDSCGSGSGSSEFNP